MSDDPNVIHIPLEADKSWLLQDYDAHFQFVDHTLEDWGDVQAMNPCPAHAVLFQELPAELPRWKRLLWAIRPLRRWPWWRRHFQPPAALLGVWEMTSSATPGAEYTLTFDSSGITFEEDNDGRPQAD